MLKCLNNLQLNGERSLFATYRHSVLLILNGEVVAHVGKTFHFPQLPQRAELRIDLCCCKVSWATPFHFIYTLTPWYSAPVCYWFNPINSHISIYYQLCMATLFLALTSHFDKSNKIEVLIKKKKHPEKIWWRIDLNSLMSCSSNPCRHKAIFSKSQISIKA